MIIINASEEYCEVWVTEDDDAICLQDETGESLYFSQKQADELLPVLEHFIKTGKLPE